MKTMRPELDGDRSVRLVRPGGAVRAAVVFALLLIATAPACSGTEPVAEPAPIDSLLHRAGRAVGDGDATAARGLYEEVLSREGSEHGALLGMAIVGLITGDPDLAIKYGRKAVEVDEGDSRSHFILANAYGMKAERGGLRAIHYGGKFREECEIAVECDPMNVDAHFALLQFYISAPGFMGGGMDKARERAETIAGIDAYRGHLARAAIASREEDQSAAEQEYLAAAAVDSTNSEGWYTLGMFYLDTERPGLAIPPMLRALGTAPDDLAAVYELARARCEAGVDLAAAEAAFRTFIAAEKRPVRPDLASAHWRLGLVLERQGRAAEALDEYRLAHELDPDHSEAEAALEALSARMEDSGKSGEVR
jgi:tetratricopeptide (TPR) repeat protein